MANQKDLQDLHNDKELELGRRINIKRTDGRVHPAYIAKINHELRCLNVEWYENGEIKGKELDMVIVQTLNPDLNLKLNNQSIPQQENTQRCSTPHSPKPKKNAGKETITSIESAARTVRGQSTDSSKIELAPVVDTGTARTSRVVKKVENLKRSREERRQRNIDEKAMNQKIDNPHRDFMQMILNYRQCLTMKPLDDHKETESHLITVCVRKRPLNKREKARNEIDVITIPSSNQLIVHEPKNRIDLTKYMENQIFRFDYAFDDQASNEIVYKYTALPLVKAIFQGGFATCFAYGQTGSGKTHTMGGNFVGRNQNCQHGIYAMATKDVFRLANSSDKYEHLHLSITASYFEIYSGKVFDLLANKAKLRVLEDGKQQVQVVGLTETQVKNTEEVLMLIQKGNLARTFGQTAANAYSSRSHAVFQLLLRSSENKQKLHGKLSLIDLAGNERGADTASTDRQTRMEGAEINKSLLALKECIRALGRKKAHLPFRMSKLTQVLKDSFIGPNSRTCMIAMISPGISSCEHSLNTLRYADRVKELVAGDLQMVKGEDIIEDIEPVASETLLGDMDDQDMSPAMISFHHILSELQLAEDQMVENHRSVVEEMNLATEKAISLLKTTDEVDFNQENYCSAWEYLLTGTIASLTKARKEVRDFKEKMADEEKLSRTTKIK